MKTVLVVDDEFDLTGTLRAILEGEGYRVETCANGREAIERLRAAPPPDLVLMDVMIPVQSGLDVLRLVRQTPGLEGLPVVLMSSVPPGVRQKDYNWQSFLRKPFTIEAVTRAVGEFIGGGVAGAGRG